MSSLSNFVSKFIIAKYNLLCCNLHDDVFKLYLLVIFPPRMIS
jgi:hypothetical protein